MKTARFFPLALRLLAQVCVPAVAPIALGTMVGCTDENDPATWTKRLEDPAQKTGAISKLRGTWESTLNKANQNREAPEVKALLDKIAEPLTKAYVAGGLEDKVRKDLMKLLADFKDPRTAPALSKAIKEWEAGKSDEDLRFACQAVIGLAKAGKMTDQAVIDALWDTFAKFRVSKATSGNLVKDLNEAVKQVKHPSYGQKATDKLNAPVNLEDEDNRRDELEFWQLTSVQVISELRHTGAIKQLLKILLTPSKTALYGVTRNALIRMAKDAEKEIIEAMKNPDSVITKEQKEKDKEKTYLALLADVLGFISRTGGRDYIMSVLPNADTVTVRHAYAQSLIQFPNEPRVVQAFRDAYNKLKPEDKSEFNAALPARAALAQIAGQLYDSSLTEWLVAESKQFKFGIKLLALDSAAKVAKSNQIGMVKAAFNSYEKEIEKDTFAKAREIINFQAAAVEQCKEDLNCYLGMLDTPIPASPPASNAKWVKAIYMIGVLAHGTAQEEGTRNTLVEKMPKVIDAVARMSLATAIDELTPKGDNAVADKLDKIVEDDKKAGDTKVLEGDDAVAKVALRLRARAMQ
jgi:hypothetical protein